MDRRSFLTLACSCLALASQPASSQRRLRTFVCTSLDTVAQGGQIALAPALPSDTGAAVGGPVTPSTAALDLTPYGSFFKESRWRPTDGLTPSGNVITLGVHFMGGSADVRQRVERAANRWRQGELANKIVFEFGVGAERSQIRVAFAPKEGNYSVVGRYALQVSASQPTMNLGDPFTPVIEHEFGHALGLEHEHMFPGAIRWRPDVVIADMLPHKWSPATTQSQITNRQPSTTACVGDPRFNKDSTMMYPIRPGWGQIQNEKGQWVEYVYERANDIHARDIACLRGVYGV